MTARDFTGKVVLITGAASGIGRHTAFAFAEAGATLELVDIDKNGLERTAELARHLSPAVTTHIVDVTSQSAMAELAKNVHARHQAVDVLFNNAGVGVGGSFLSSDLATWDWAYAINVRGVVHGCYFFIPQMLKRGTGGHVLNMSSGAGLAASKHTPIYSMTKFAVTGLSEALRDEVEPNGIIVTTVCPGIIDTPIIGSSRYSNDLMSDPGHVNKSERAYGRRAYGPERVADIVLKAVREKKAGVLPVSPEAWLTHLGKRFTPNLVRKMMNLELS